MTNERAETLAKCGCGGEATLIASKDDRWHVECKKCCLYTAFVDVGMDAFSLWNRAMSPASPGAVEALRDALKRLGSMEAFEGSRAVDKNNPADQELLARIDYARAALAALPPSAQEKVQRQPGTGWEISEETQREIKALEDYTRASPARLRAMEILTGASSPSGQPEREVPRPPLQPTEAMWGGLARDLIMWRDMNDRPTGKSLYRHLERCGREIPQWLRDEIPDTDHVPPKGTRAAVIWKAMYYAWDASPAVVTPQGAIPPLQPDAKFAAETIIEVASPEWKEGDFQFDALTVARAYLALLAKGHGAERLWLSDLLAQRDEFIVENGLWEKFTTEFIKNARTNTPHPRPQPRRRSK